MKKLFALVLAVFVALSAAACGGDATQTTTAQNDVATDATTDPIETTAALVETTVPAETVPETTAPLGTQYNPYMPGMYKVGYDLPAGEYLFLSISDRGAYVCVSSDSNADDILENAVFDHTFIVTVEDGQYLDATRCAFVLGSECIININADGSFGSGMYRVGVDIGAGEYKLTATDGSGYWCIYNDSRVPLDIVDNDLFETNAYVTVKDGQYLDISDAIATPVDVEPVVKETEAPTESSKSSFPALYVLDNAEMKFHYAHCRLLDNVSREDQETMEAVRQDLIDAGYSPCEKCRS